MIGKTNSGIILGIINVTCPNPSTITVTNGNLSFTGSGTYASFKLPRAGTWTITATYNGITVTKDVTITPGQVLATTIGDSVMLYDRGSYANGFASGWSVADYGTYVAISTNAGPVTSDSTGSVNLTGYRTVKARIEGGIGGTSDTHGQIWFSVINGSGTLIVTHTESYSPPEWGGSETFDTTGALDVSEINYSVRFQLRAETWAGGSDSRHANISLYKIELLA